MAEVQHARVDAAAEEWRRTVGTVVEDVAKEAAPIVEQAVAAEVPAAPVVEHVVEEVAKEDPSLVDKLKHLVEEL